VSAFTVSVCIYDNQSNFLFNFLHLVSGTVNVSTLLIKFLMRTIYLPVCFLGIMFSIVPLLTPRIPPFVGHFFCRLSHDWLDEDVCGLDDDELFNLVGSRTKWLFNMLRIIGGGISLVVYTSQLWNVVLVICYETFPSILFQKDRLSELQVKARNCTFPEHFHLILEHRELHILNCMFNDIYKTDYFVFCMGSALLILIPNGYFVLTVHHVTPLFLVMAIYTTIMEYMVVIILFSISSKVWKNSVEFTWYWKRNHQLSRKRLTRRYGKSLQILKIKIGSTNFVELNTTFVFFSFCIEQTINLILLQKK
jgi:hypothetical protein